VATRELLRVLKPGGTLAFSTWPPELFVGRMFALIGQFVPPPPPGVSPPPQWGEPTIIRERLGDGVRDIVFDRASISVPALSLGHYRDMTERTAGPMQKLVESLKVSDPVKLDEFRRTYDALSALYYADNAVRQDYLMTRAVKR
jgi:hypothetical protein